MSRRPVLRRLGRSTGVTLLGALALIAGSEGTQNAQANGDTRSLTLHHTHRGDQITVTFKRNGRYDAEGLRQLSYFLRDWRNNKQTRMEPKLFDTVWEVHRSVGRGQMINIVSAYRSPETNAMLQARSRGVAKFSQHMLGRAMDFYITGVPVSAVREAGMRLQRGGVGFYPTSGRPFVHLDAGNVRAWPRMTRTQLAKLFPDGKTVHLPADGKPLPGYQLAMAELKSSGSVSVSDAYASSGSAKGKGFFARLFGGGDEGDEVEAAPTMVASAQGAKTRAAASSSSDEDAAPVVKTVVARMVPLPPVAPARAPAAAPAPEIAVASAAIPLPPVAPARAPAAETVVASAAIPLPPTAPVIAAKPVPVPAPAPQEEIQVAAAEPAEQGPQMVWRTGPQSATASSAERTDPGLAIASAIPTPRPRPTATSAVAVLAALPTPAPADRTASVGRPREIDPQAAVAYQAEAGTFPRLPDAFLGKAAPAAQAAETALAYAPQAADHLPTARAVASPSRVTVAAPQVVEPGVRVLSPDATPSAVYAAALAPQRLRAKLPSQPMVTARMDEQTLRVAVKPVRAARDADDRTLQHPDQIHLASLMAPPAAALVGGFGADPTHGARSDRFAGSSVMLLRTRSFAPTPSQSAGLTRSRG